MDQRVSRYETWEELLGYCRCRPTRSGELVLDVFGRADPRRVRALGLDLHRPAADRALAGRGRGPARAAGSTCPLEDLRASAAGEHDLRRRPRRRRCARCSRSRSPAPAPCWPRPARSLRGAAGAEPDRRRGLHRRRARRARRDRAGRLRRARRPAARARPTACSLGRARRDARRAAGRAASEMSELESRAPTRRCEAITRAQAANFYYGIRLLPAESAPRDVRRLRVRAPRRRHRRRHARGRGEARGLRAERRAACAGSGVAGAAARTRDGRAGGRLQRASRSPLARSRS